MCAFVCTCLLRTRRHLGEAGPLLPPLPPGSGNRTQIVSLGSKRLSCQVILSTPFWIVFIAMSSNSLIFSSEISSLLLIRSSLVFLRYCIFILENFRVFLKNLLCLYTTFEIHYVLL